MKNSYIKLLVIILIGTGLLSNLSCSSEDNPVEPTNNSPVVTITAPLSKASFYLGDTILFTATAVDPEDGDLTDSSLVWTSDIDGQIGVGKLLNISDLSANRHVITLTAIDKNNNFDTANITVNVFITFEKIFGGLNDEYGWSVVETSDNGFVTVGYTYSFGAGYSDIYLIKTDNSGNLIWEKTFGGISGDVGYSVCNTSDDGFIITGSTSSSGAGYSDIYLIKADNSGNLIWEKTFGGVNDEAGYSICETSDGGFILAGVTESYEPIGANVYLIKTDNSGNLVWEKTFGSYSADVGYSVYTTSDNGFIITGITRLTGLVNRYVYIVKTDINGDLVWENHFGGFNDDYGYSVKEVSDGGYIITGSTTSSGAGNSDVYLIKTDNNGRLVWEKTFGHRSYDVGKSVSQTTDGGFIIAGYTSSVELFGAGGYDSYLIKTDNNGNLIWEKTFGGVDNDYATSVCQSKDGGFILTGYTTSMGAGGRDVYLIKTDPNGNVKKN